jgi:lipopolysaccharide export system protein LptA
MKILGNLGAGLRGDRRSQLKTSLRAQRSNPCLAFNSCEIASSPLAPRNDNSFLLFRLPLILLALLLSARSIGLAADEKANGSSAKGQNPFDISLNSGKGPINIRSGKLEYFYNEKRIVYRGGVVVTRDNGTIKSDLLTVTYEEQPVTSPTKTATGDKPATSHQRIKEAVAEGSVEITSENGNATCKKAVFNEIKRTVTLSGDAVLRDGGNVVKGEVVTVYLDESKVVVEGDANMRPEMEITPKQDEKGKKEAKAR